jgi:pSer/pThr/pTyr-binding forkhead associated (FHA) protein
MTRMHDMTRVAGQLTPGVDATPPCSFKLQVVIESYTGPLAGRTLTVDRELVIGRDSSADLTLVGGLISRRHVLVRAVDSGLEIEDISSNGTVVNGATLRRESLRVGNECTLGVGCMRLWLSRVLPKDQGVRVVHTK